jgi:short-subunit dehydrogenase
MKTALVISGTSDLGGEIALDLAKRNFSLQLTARNPIDLQKLEQELISKNRIKVSTFRFDAQDIQSSSTLVQNLDIIPDIVFICTGYLGENERALRDREEMLRIIDTNFRGLAILLQGLAQKMEPVGGIIVGISSVSGERGRQGNFFYGSAKSAFTTLIDGYRHFYSDDKLKFVTVIPGFIKTKMLQEKTSGLMTLSAKKAASIIVRKSLKGSHKFFVGGIWYWVMMIIRNIPESIFLKLKI